MRTNERRLLLSTQSMYRYAYMKHFQAYVLHAITCRLCWLIAGHENARCTFETFRKCTKLLGLPSNLKAGNRDIIGGGGPVNGVLILHIYFFL